MSVAAIQNEILGLSATERAKLIDLLWDSLANPEGRAREAVWAEESERPIDAFDARQMKVREAQSVFSDLRRNLRK